MNKIDKELQGAAPHANDKDDRSQKGKKKQSEHKEDSTGDFIKESNCLLDDIKHNLSKTCQLTIGKAESCIDTVET
ncbi:hypothetical protein ABVT39_026696 [Epinephelus coioides]